MDLLAEANPDAAASLDRAFGEKARYAADRPALYKQGRYPGTREIVIRRNYVMVYRVGSQVVEIIRILHARQQWP